MSTLQVTTLRNAAGVEVYTCKAWVNFNGTGTVAIRASGNVSSITDNGSGDYTVNFASAMADANYAVVCTSEDSFNDNLGAVMSLHADFAQTTSGVRVINHFFGASQSAYDGSKLNVVVFR